MPGLPGAAGRAAGGGRGHRRLRLRHGAEGLLLPRVRRGTGAGGAADRRRAVVALAAEARLADGPPPQGYPLRPRTRGGPVNRDDLLKMLDLSGKEPTTSPAEPV